MPHKCRQLVQQPLCSEHSVDRQATYPGPALDSPAPLGLTQASVQLRRQGGMAKHSVGRLQHVCQPLLHAPLPVLRQRFCPFSFCGLRQEDGGVSSEGLGRMTQVGVICLVGQHSHCIGHGYSCTCTTKHSGMGTYLTQDYCQDVQLNAGGDVIAALDMSDDLQEYEGHMAVIDFLMVNPKPNLT